MSKKRNFMETHGITVCLHEFLRVPVSNIHLLLVHLWGAYAIPVALSIVGRPSFVVFVHTACRCNMNMNTNVLALVRL